MSGREIIGEYDEDFGGGFDSHVSVAVEQDDDGSWWVNEGEGAQWNLTEREGPFASREEAVGAAEAVLDR